MGGWRQLLLQNTCENSKSKPEAIQSQFHKALSTNCGAWNANFAAPKNRNGVPNTKIQFHIKIMCLNTKIGA